MTSPLLSKASTPIIPDASRAISITVGASATAGDSLATLDGKFVEIRAYGGPIYISAAPAEAASEVTAPTTEAGADPGLLIEVGTPRTFALLECPKQKAWFIRAISDGAGRTLVISPTSR